MSLVNMLRPFDAFDAANGSPATAYAADGVTNPTPLTIDVSNSRTLATLGRVAGDLFWGHVPSTVVLSVGQLLAIPSLPGQWFVVVRVTQRGQWTAPPLAVGTSVAMLALPYQVTTRRATRSGTTVQPGALDGWDEPVGLTGGGLVNEQEDTLLVRCGFSNQSDPLGLALEGQTPSGVTTLYAPLGASIRLGDEVRAVDVRDASGAVLPTTALPPLQAAYTVTAVNHLFADGTPYALQALLSNATGSGT
jgi:hypothetical protein